MILKSLEIQGFKSFPDKTKLRFDKGLTAVVGPNGSGKSNISDAVRWVLGEQSTKTLRGTKMEDVIFNGTQTRKSQGYALVTLTFDNTDHFLPVDSDDVTISRKFYKSGESEYLINGSGVRLKDVNELLMDTGLGRDGYAMIGQGKIAEIVGAKSTERREIFEEAAGISKFRYRKQEAERRLKMAEENLVRLRDILLELESRVEPLRIQSVKARQFIELSEEKKALQISIWAAQLENAKENLRAQEDKIYVCEANYDAISAEIEEMEHEVQEVYDKMQKCLVDIERKRRDKDEIEAGVAKNQSAQAVLKNDIAHNESDISRIESEIANYSKSFADIEEEIHNKQTGIASLRQEIAEEQEKLQRSEEELLHLNSQNQGFTESTKQLNEQQNALTLEETGVRIMVDTAEKMLTELEQSLSEAQAGKASKEAEICTAKKELEELSACMDTMGVKKSELQNSVKGYELKLQSRKEKLHTLQASCEVLAGKINEKQQKAKVLEDLERNMEGYAYSVKTIVSQAKKGAIRGVSGTVSQLIQVDNAYAGAIETALGGALQNIVVDNENTAKSAIRILKENKSGRATFLPLTSVKESLLQVSGLENYDGYVNIASELVSCDSKYKHIIRYLLGRIVIVEDLDTGTEIANKYGYKFRIVTLDGQVINAGGSFTGGSKSKNTGMLSRKNDIAALLSQVKELAQEKCSFDEKVQKISEETGRLSAQITNINSEISVLNEDFIRMEGEEKRLQHIITEGENVLKNAVLQITQIREKQKANEQIKQDQSRRLQEIQNEAQEIQAQIAETQSSYEDLREQRHELSDSIAAYKMALLAKQKDIESQTDAIEELKNRQASADQSILTLQGQVEALREKNQQLEKDIEDTVKAVQAGKDSLKAIAREIQVITNEREALEASTTNFRRLEREKSADRENISKELARLEERKIAIEKEYDQIIAQMWEEYQLTRSDLEEKADKIESVLSAQRDLNAVKNKIKNLGNVNVGAIEEYAEVSERYTFMRKQLSDVEQSKAELIELIADLTKNMQELFLENFQLINKHFGRIFVELFGGGKASLELSDYENILDCGIEIFVQPPGKVIKNLASLSGGEQAFVAIAIYFAILKVRPSPFCILDEIEAALDDVNVVKYAHYLRSMSHNTQFILITHRRGTMEEADVLYGVTMQEEGVSKLLELKVTEVEEKLKL